MADQRGEDQWKKMEGENKRQDTKLKEAKAEILRLKDTELKEAEAEIQRLKKKVKQFEAKVKQIEAKKDENEAKLNEHDARIETLEEEARLLVQMIAGIDSD